jgi:hypothetical protein
MAKVHRKKRGGKLKCTITENSPNTEDSDSDSDSLSSTSDGSFGSSLDNAGKNKRKRKKQWKKKSHHDQKKHHNDDESSWSSWCSSSSTTSSNPEHVIIYEKYLKKFTLLISSLDDKMKMSKYSSVERKYVFKRTFNKVISIVKWNKKEVRPKRRGGIKSLDYMFHAWGTYGEEYPDKKNSVCIETQYRLNNWVKEQHRKFTNSTLSEERYGLLMTNGFVFAPRKAVLSEQGRGVLTIAELLQLQRKSVPSEQVRGVPMIAELAELLQPKTVSVIAESLQPKTESEQGSGVSMIAESLLPLTVPSEQGTGVLMIVESLLPLTESEEVLSKQGWAFNDSRDATTFNRE